MYSFDAKKVKNDLVKWLRKYYDNDGNLLNAVIGCSGGKDSSVVLAALSQAIGPDRIYAILMPNGTQQDIKDSYRVCEQCGVVPRVCNISDAYRGVLASIGGECEITETTTINLAPVIRMATLKAISQSVNGRFTCNGNLSERYVGYFTLDGDDRGAIKPLANLTATEVKAIGYELGLPKEFIEKAPSDGLCGKTDEDNLGFTYEVLDNYIRTGICDDPSTKARIDELHRKNLFKLEPMPCFGYNGPILGGNNHE